ncbi:hypothetical protein Taro_039321 [Colocasia esculenta]|uniref:Vacuolar cation/proton exchanger n=1 Tax=Colocasia esculenta TaxID=4460 RepID=A0A843WII6_COLES|nr:hypothetical protein [Colocasia esculenta]
MRQPRVANGIGDGAGSRCGRSESAERTRSGRMGKGGGGGPDGSLGCLEEKTDEEENLVGPSVAARKMHSLEVSQPSISDRKHHGVLDSITIVLFKAKINLLLPFGPMAILLHYLTQKHGWVFIFSLIGITPLAERLGYATEQLAHFTGPTIGGLLNATFGNATEMIISIYALKNGMIRVVQQSLLGSILSNMLLVLGCAFFAGGVVNHRKDQVFNKAAAVVNSGLLLMAVMGLMFPAVLHFTHSEVQYGKSEIALSRFSSCIMLIAYASYLVFQLKCHHNLYNPVDEEEGHNEDGSDEDEEPEISRWEAIIWLAVLTIWVSVLSGYLVDAIQGASESMNMPVAFISVILLPIVGNAAEHASAIMFAMKDKLDITLGVAIGSSTQISMFVDAIVMVASSGHPPAPPNTYTGIGATSGPRLGNFGSFFGAWTVQILLRHPRGL